MNKSVTRHAFQESAWFLTRTGRYFNASLSRSGRSRFQPFKAALAFLTILGASVCAVSAQDISKANNANPLNTGASWVGGVVPGAANIALWDTNIIATPGPSYPLGGDLGWAGLAIGAYGQFTNAFFNPNTGSSSLITITNNGLNTLTLGASGLDLSLSTNNLVITNIKAA